MSGRRFGIWPAIVAAGLLLLTSPVAAQTAASPPAPALPALPTTKILAIGSVTTAGMTEARRAVMPNEVRDTVQLYLHGKIDQWYARQDGRGVVFLLNVGTVEEAHSLLEALPLGQAKMMTFELIPLGPLAPLGLLMTR